MIMKTLLKQKIFFFALLAVFVGYLAVCIPLYNSVIKKINNSYFDIAKDSAQIISKAISGQFTITDEEFDELLNIEYKELPSNKTNVRFEKIVRSITSTNNLNTDIKYAYVMFLLPEERVQYKIETDDEAEYYGAQKGTKLSLIWLLNVNITNSRYDDSSNYIEIDEDYLTNKNRYSFLRDYDVHLYESEQAGITISNDEYGEEYISGLIPIYTTSDKYIGLLGVDIFVENYYKVMEQTKKVFMIIFIVFTALFAVLLVALYSYGKHLRMAESKTNVSYNDIDPLTGLYNYTSISRYEQDILKRLKISNASIIALLVRVENLTGLCQKYDQGTIDNMLASVGACIKNNIRMPQDFPLKYSANEFVIIFNSIPLYSVEMIAERIREQINITNGKMDINDLELSISIAKTGAKNAGKLEDIIFAAKNIAKSDEANQINVTEF